MKLNDQRNMTVYLVGPSIQQKGGVATVLKELAEHFKGGDLEVRVLATTSSEGTLCTTLSFLRTWFRLLQIKLSSRQAIIHLHMASRGSCLRKSILAATCKVIGIPYIVHLHGAEFRSFYSDELNATGQAIVRFVFRKAFMVIALSKSWENWIEETMGIDNTVTIFNGTPITERNVTPDKRPTILFLGKLCERKGVDELISAMRQVKARIPNVVLELGGDGELSKYRDLAEGIPDIKFLGWVDQDARSAALSRATIFCLPSKNEGLPMSILEAMSAGLPVVSTPVGGIPEAVVPNVTGLLTQPGDVSGLANALIDLIDKPEAASRMGIEGKSRHRLMFSSESMGESCRAVYDKYPLT